jgi:site-specific DNA recombinase
VIRPAPPPEGPRIHVRALSHAVEVFQPAGRPPSGVDLRAAKAVRTKKSKAKTPQLKPYHFRGLFRCGECGCCITTETQKGHNYLRCTKRMVPCSQKYVREENALGQINEMIAAFTDEAQTADRVIATLETEAREQTEAGQGHLVRFRLDLTACEAKLDALLDMALNKAIAEEEYLPKKHILLNRKAELREKIAAAERQGTNRFEPMIRFVKASKYGFFQTKSQNLEAKRDFLKKVGSNLLVSGKTISRTFKNPWKIASDFNSQLVSPTAQGAEISQNLGWRRERDSNPRYLLSNHAFQACALNHSAISPTSASPRLPDEADKKRA